MKTFFVALLGLLLLTANAEAKGHFETLDCDGFRLHVYNSGDVMADTSFIVEGKDGLVTMELPLFKENAKEFDAYVAALKKPVVQVVTNYHAGSAPGAPVFMPQGMPAFMKGEVYTGMLAHFRQTFGDSMVDIAEVAATEVPFGETVTLAGVPFTFLKGAASDFPAASIIIGKQQVYYSHWTPAKAHTSHLQTGTPQAIDAEIDAAQAALASGCRYFVGGHGGIAGEGALQFRLDYLKALKKLRADCATAEDFMAAVKKAYPGLPGEEGLKDLAQALYK